MRTAITAGKTATVLLCLFCSQSAFAKQMEARILAKVRHPYTFTYPGSANCRTRPSYSDGVSTECSEVPPRSVTRYGAELYLLLDDGRLSVVSCVPGKAIWDGSCNIPEEGMNVEVDAKGDKATLSWPRNMSLENNSVTKYVKEKYRVEFIASKEETDRMMKTIGKQLENEKKADE